MSNWLTLEPGTSKVSVLSAVVGCYVNNPFKISRLSANSVEIEFTYL